jgi:hypothetical protein
MFFCLADFLAVNFGNTIRVITKLQALEIKMQKHSLSV